MIKTTERTWQTQYFARVVVSTSGPELEIDFVERGLEPGQNYAYFGYSTGSETYQCYKSRTFTPMPKTITVQGSTESDSRAYRANADGVVRGFIFEDLITQIPTTFHCGKQNELVPIHVCYSPYDLVQFAEPFDVYYFPDGARGRALGQVLGARRCRSCATAEAPSPGPRHR